MSVGRKAGKGFVSYLFRSALEKVMGIIAMVFLARRLTPYDFGLVSITEVLLTLISVIGTTGLAEFLLAYRKEDTEEIFKAAFWFNLIITIGIIVLFFAAVPFWSAWQHDETIRNISWVEVYSFFLNYRLYPKHGLVKT
jgi:O-antigen/teichoic acid export membrane protein